MTTAARTRREDSISIITATYNAACYLPGLIESLRNQIDKNFDWIVVDGGSTDGTVELLEQSRDVVTRHVSELDFGIYHALNKGILMCQTDYYLVMGADDILLPEAIANYKRAVAENQPDLITAPVMMKGKRVRWRSLEWPWLFSMFAYVSSHAVGLLIKRKLHEQFGFYSLKYPLAADRLFVMLACKGGASLYKADFCAGVYGIHGTSAKDVATSLTDVFRVQLETRCSKLLSVLVFLLRLIKRYSDL